MEFNTWLDDQRRYQADTFGVDYPLMWTEPDAEVQTEYVKEMTLAAFAELGEALNEMPWKSWAKLDRREAWRKSHDKVVGELVDVLFFVGNVLAAVGCTDIELATRYNEKMGVNRQRQADGYDGVSTKCPNCNRALDEPGTVAYAARNGVIYCSTVCAETDESRCARCGRVWQSPFELRAIGLDKRLYCGTEHAVDSTGGQLDPEDYDL